ncbi:hypothetical protein OTU49_002200 [Cherax quadricarinatus]|uniref:Uncharacterized protein n=1 Tax=Cherax quadricarinatus TaxID=27406 RepID=A0AAW0XBW5_CHEQU
MCLAAGKCSSVIARHWRMSWLLERASMLKEDTLKDVPGCWKVLQCHCKTLEDVLAAGTSFNAQGRHTEGCAWLLESAPVAFQDTGGCPGCWKVLQYFSSSLHIKVTLT